MKHKTLIALLCIFTSSLTLCVKTGHKQYYDKQHPLADGTAFSEHYEKMKAHSQRSDILGILGLIGTRFKEALPSCNCSCDREASATLLQQKRPTRSGCLRGLFTRK